MKRAVLLLTLFVALACSSGRTGSDSGGSTPPGQGAISIEIIPNPIVATKVSGDTYDFPLEVVIRETGGRRVSVTRVSADVIAFGSIRVGNESYDAARIQELGFSTTVPASSSLRYRFAPRRDVPDERLFGGVTAELRVDAVDDLGNQLNARTSVSITR